MAEENPLENELDQPIDDQETLILMILSQLSQMLIIKMKAVKQAHQEVDFLI